MKSTIGEKMRQQAGVSKEYRVFKYEGSKKLDAVEVFSSPSYEMARDYMFSCCGGHFFIRYPDEQ